MSTSSLIKRLQDFIPGFVLLFALFLIMTDPFFIITNARNGIFDLYQRIKPREYIAAWLTFKGRR